MYWGLWDLGIYMRETRAEEQKRIRRERKLALRANNQATIEEEHGRPIRITAAHRSRRFVRRMLPHWSHPKPREEVVV